MTQRKHPIYFGQIMLMKACREATDNQALLARAALVLGACEARGPVDLKELITRLTWQEYQALLNVLALHANTALRWDEAEQAELRLWAQYGDDETTIYASDLTS
jgi:hypothetical protein